jgi:hypothetical protein
MMRYYPATLCSPPIDTSNMITLPLTPYMTQPSDLGVTFFLCCFNFMPLLADLKITSFICC